MKVNFSTNKSSQPQNNHRKNRLVLQICEISQSNFYICSDSLRFLILWSLNRYLNFKPRLYKMVKIFFVTYSAKNYYYKADSWQYKKGLNNIIYFLYIKRVHSAQCSKLTNGDLLAATNDKVSPGNEASVTDPDFTISEFGSSCNYLFFCLNLASFLASSVYLHPQGRMGCQEIGNARK